MATSRIAMQQRDQEKEVVEMITRTTKGGVNEPSRQLRYKLKVIQQPERARACGSGAKSSADRRPVDPPPVVELKIFEVEGDRETDITFGYKANFFLFATLETARPMAHGRVQPAANQVPVLTGMPVSGMAYLDRPVEAGYFIFPDLSVRHEGKYKLSFNLYEQTKLEDDADAEPNTDERKSKMLGGIDPDSSFDWRLEVKSNVFTVFSAKKFPGLAESTHLSRTVAEQGCRVRIRRDVRMRRRDNKPDYEEEIQHEEYNRVGRPPTRDEYERARSRSLSSESDDRQHPGSRRGSGEWNAVPPGGLLNFGGQYQQQQPQFATPMPMPSRAPFTQPQYHHSQPPFQPAPVHTHPGPNYGIERGTVSAYPSTYPREHEFEDPNRRQSFAGYPSRAPTFPPVDHFSRNPASFQSNFPQSPVARLAPILPSAAVKYDGPQSPLGPIDRISHPPFISPDYDRRDERSAVPPPYQSLQAAPELHRNFAALGKRTAEEAFNPAATHQPLYNGARPSSSHANHADEDNEIEKQTMVYKRADGYKTHRLLPIGVDE